MGLYDVPAFIDFILSTTGFSKLSYVGHSEGTTQLFIGMSMLPAYYASKLNLFIALAPIANLGHTTSSLMRTVAKFDKLIEFVAVDLLGLYDLFTLNWWEDELAMAFCHMLPGVCEGMLELIADLDASVDNLDRVNTYLTHIPSGACYKNLVHYAQSINTGRFARYDYGARVNRQKYS